MEALLRTSGLTIPLLLFLWWFYKAPVGLVNRADQWDSCGRVAKINSAINPRVLPILTFFLNSKNWKKKSHNNKTKEYLPLWVCVTEPFLKGRVWMQLCQGFQVVQTSETPERGSRDGVALCVVQNSGPCSVRCCCLNLKKIAPSSFHFSFLVVSFVFPNVVPPALQSMAAFTWLWNILCLNLFPPALHFVAITAADQCHITEV